MDAHIDLNYLQRFCKDDRARMERYVDMYLKGSPAMFSDLQARSSAGDAEGLAVAAHSLRPQVNYMGATEIFDLLTRIETEARENGVGPCSPMVERCIALNTEVLLELQRWREGG